MGDDGDGDDGDVSVSVEGAAPHDAMSDDGCFGPSGAGGQRGREGQGAGGQGWWARGRGRDEMTIRARYVACTVRSWLARAMMGDDLAPFREERAGAKFNPPLTLSGRGDGLPLRRCRSLNSSNRTGQPARRHAWPCGRRCVEWRRQQPDFEGTEGYPRNSPAVCKKVQLSLTLSEQFTSGLLAIPAVPAPARAAAGLKSFRRRRRRWRRRPAGRPSGANHFAGLALAVSGQGNDHLNALATPDSTLCAAVKF